MENRLDKYKKIILAGVGTIFLGAIGSGVWDWVLSGFFSWLGNSFITTMATISDSYVNSLYKNIWRGNSYPYLKDIYIFTFTVYITLPLMLMLVRRIPMTSKNESSKDRRRKFSYKLIMLSSALLVVMVIKVWETSYTSNVTQKFTANISILSPHLDNKQILLLNSKLRMINDRKSANELRLELEKYSQLHGVTIHEMDFL